MHLSKMVSSGVASLAFALPMLGFAQASASNACSGSSCVSPRDLGWNTVVQKDVIIMGGGASGLYAALRLREMGKSVVVVEERENFGGHTSTYTVPGTGAPINFGVQVFGGDETAIRRFFGFYNIPLIQVQPSMAPQSNTRHVDFKTPTGLQTIKASKLLISAPPTLENMAPLLLDSREIPLFSSFKSQGYFVGMVNVTGFAPGDEFYNMAPGATYSLPQLPALYQISPTSVAGIYQVNYGAQEDYYPEMLVKADIIATVERVRRSVLGATVAQHLPPVKLLAFSSHTPFSLRVSAGEISSGFYTKLDGLQGYRSTWYTGAAFSGHHASHVWKFTEDIVNRRFA
ncbi:hypothetical protein B0T19DRAFT_457001 [Cercophora scortea]|uniref:Amine oxidase n=1 Tax=Cercophora scortea TaxID=314031 RepID=A0AAE0MH17_9PEZI|nr:hypothetical protein B0T19DRAFT_457001 [Cercophora scortea]